MPSPKPTSAGSNTSSARLLEALRHGPLTVDEVAEALSMTPAGARLQLSKLQREGLVVLVGQRAGTRKPFNEYGLSPLGEQALSRAYLPVLHALVSSLGDQFSEEQSRQLFERVGQQLARDIPRPRTGATRESSATAVVRALGGSVQVSTEAGVVRTASRSCPLAELVRINPITCEAVRSLLEEVTGTPVRQCCTHGEHPACAFEFAR